MNLPAEFVVANYLIFEQNYVTGDCSSEAFRDGFLR